MNVVNLQSLTPAENRSLSRSRNLLRRKVRLGGLWFFHLLSLEIFNSFEFLRKSVLEFLASRIRAPRLRGRKPRSEVSVIRDTT